jgi:phage/plasmid-like protein (TIGR03299 family)
MPANIARDSTGKYLAMYADSPAWHNLGTVVAGAQSPEEAMRVAGTGFTVATAPVFANIDGASVEVPTHRATYRTDTQSVLGVVSADYRPIQNITPMQMLGEIVRTKEAGIVAHAALGRGERLFAVLELARLKDIHIPYDQSRHEGFLVAQWWHDGTGALSIGPYTNRVECQNMANAQLAYAEGRNRLVRIIHTGNVDDSVEEARRILGYAETAMVEYAGTMAAFAEVSLPDPVEKWAEGFGQRLIPIPPDMERPLARNEARDLIKQLIVNSDNMRSVPNNAYRAFQAVVEYADHYRPVRIGNDGRSAERRFTSLVDGPAADIKRRAIQLLNEEFEVTEAIRS